MLVKDNDELDKLTNYLNKELNSYLKENLMTENEINRLTDMLCKNYEREAKIEYSDLEKLRIESLEYFNENGNQEGHTLQPLAKKWKELDNQYHNFINTEETIRIGSEIFKRSNIEKEKLTEIPTDKILDFYEQLIKAEKKVIENDIRLYIQRNMYLFKNISPTRAEMQNEKDRVETTLESFLELVRENPLQNYLNLVKKHVKNANFESDTSFANSKDYILGLFNQMKQEQELSVLNEAENLERLAEVYIKDVLNKKGKPATNHTRNIKYFTDYMKGNGKKHQPKKLSELTSEDIIEFQNLLVNIIIRTRRHQGMSLFELVSQRIIENSRLMKPSNMNGIEYPIKGFYKHLCKAYKNLDGDSDLIDYLDAQTKLELLREDDNEVDYGVRGIEVPEMTRFANIIYKDANTIEKMLNESPQNFYTFLLGLVFGVRIREGLQLKIRNLKVQEKDGQKYYYFYLDENDNDTRLKTSNSHRNLPIPNVLIRLGILTFIDRRRELGYETLFNYKFNKKSQEITGALNIFYQRAFQKCFGELACNEANIELLRQRVKDGEEAYEFIQYRSFRKNFVNVIDRQKIGGNYHTITNIKKLIGHSDSSATEYYYERIEPFVGYQILNSFDYFFHYPFLERLEEDIKEVFNDDIKYELDWVTQKNDEEWKIKSKIKKNKGKTIIKDKN
ncbi:hypothetical protein [Poseidonibacter ostreae]|uniref:Uncharacterized protein n=1 Tax=Poseidonibacter ostreae TaxID=2654171 RepID=A0A6L4WPZ5_9BACT|nr:hypothetical protein [Poseidonibacter ostreae]KAB7884618.1 hypothetical protein GBG19_15535 [Poseidonibacter ostreae]